ncbi:hypothetical protein [Chromobacterium vaccinii]|uniref:hypothetical protein n=1 Tax=Chromobacterium vaccinii TaxID=1108595 RepID=UPI00345B4907
MKRIAMLLGVAATYANAAVIECAIGNGQSIYTAAQFCPAGTTYKRMMLNVDDPNIAMMKAQGENSRPALPPQLSCDQLRSQRDFYDRALAPNSPYHVDQPLTKRQQVINQMTLQDCRI